MQLGRKVQSRNGRTTHEWCVLNLSCGHDQVRPELKGVDVKRPSLVRCELCPELELVK